MSTILFNTTDLVLAFTTLLAVLFAIIVLVHNTPVKISHYFLAGFLLAFSLNPVHVLLLYGEHIREQALNYNPNLLLTFKLGYWLVGPFLFLYTRSIATNNYKYKPLELMHFLPCLFYIVYLYFVFYRFDHQIKVELINSYTIQQSAHYIVMFLLQFTHIATYTIISIFSMQQFRNIIASQYSSSEAYELRWLKTLLYGFLSLMFTLHFVLIIFFATDSPKIADQLGIALNYFNFIFCFILLVAYIKHSSSMVSSGLEKIPTKNDANEKITLNDVDIEKIKNSMLEKKLFMDPELTIQQLSKAVGIPIRTVSNIINRHFKKNFHEFINGYRINESKILLAEQNMQHIPITDIYLKVGFNSRSTFNTFFKKQIGKTPTQYRQENSKPSRSNIKYLNQNTR